MPRLRRRHCLSLISSQLQLHESGKQNPSGNWLCGGDLSSDPFHWAHLATLF